MGFSAGLGEFPDLAGRRASFTPQRRVFESGINLALWLGRVGGFSPWIMPGPTNVDSSAPRGTILIVAAFGALVVAGWLLLYFGLFLPRTTP
jgi:hypothetical protein